jgi:hypothetical protein
MSTPIKTPMTANLVGSMIDCAHINRFSPQILIERAAPYRAAAAIENPRRASWNRHEPAALQSMP